MRLEYWCWVLFHYLHVIQLKFCFDHPGHFWFEKQRDNSASAVYADLIVQFVKILPDSFVAWPSSASGYAFTYSVIELIAPLRRE